MIALEPFFTLESGGIIGATDFALEGGGGGSTDPTGFVGITELAECDFDEGGGGGMAAENLDGELMGDSDLPELEDPGDGDRRTFLPGDMDADLLAAGVGDGVLGIVLLLGDVDGEVGLSGDILYDEKSGDFVGHGDNPVVTGLNDAGCGLGEGAIGFISLQKMHKTFHQ